jgi:hypothetical protein
MPPVADVLGCGIKPSMLATVRVQVAEARSVLIGSI